jgi:hypothetical protein
MPRRRVHLMVTLAVLGPACGIAVADNPKAADPATDAELLEFLGSVDSGADSQAAADDGSWIEYLAQADISKVAKTAGPNGASQPAAAGTHPPATKPSPGDKKDE